MLRTIRTLSVSQRVPAQPTATAFGTPLGVVCVDALGRIERVSPARNRFARRWPR